MMTHHHHKLEMPVPIPDYYVAPETPFLYQKVYPPIVISVMLSFIAIFSSLFLAIQQETPSAAYAVYEQPQRVIIEPSPVVVQFEENQNYYAEPVQEYQQTYEGDPGYPEGEVETSVIYPEDIPAQ